MSEANRIIDAVRFAHQHPTVVIFVGKTNDTISPDKDSRGDLFFYRELRRAPGESLVGRQHRSFAANLPQGQGYPSLPNRRHGCSARTPPLPVDPPQGDADYKTRWALIKAGFSRAISPGEQRSESRAKRGERGIWQRRYWEHMIRDDRDFEQHADYIHWNPVKHGWVERVRDWPYSSFHQHVRQGIYPTNWSDEPEITIDPGE